MPADRAAPPGTGLPVTQLVAYVGHQRCTLSAVDAASAAAARADLPLVVVYERPKIPTFTQLNVPNAVATYEEIDCVVFNEVAALVAPHAVAWDFRAVPGGTRADRVLPARELGVSRVYAAGWHHGHLLAAVHSYRAARALERLRRCAVDVETLRCGRFSAALHQVK
jgi:hypothetical protein